MNVEWNFENFKVDLKYCRKLLKDSDKLTDANPADQFVFIYVSWLVRRKVYLGNFRLSQQYDTISDP